MTTIADSMNTRDATIAAASAPTRFVNTKRRTLAYRSVGGGPVIILCNRFRGTLDTWDPAFIDALARTFTVITFDYSGIGRSTGAPPSSATRSTPSRRTTTASGSSTTTSAAG